MIWYIIEIVSEFVQCAMIVYLSYHLFHDRGHVGGLSYHLRKIYRYIYHGPEKQSDGISPEDR